MHSKKGFTLIELIIVVSIIGVLSTLGFSTYNSVQQDARNSKRKSDLAKVKGALESYKLEHNGMYPTTGSAWRGLCSNNSYNPSGSLTDTGASGYIPTLANTYIEVLPRDPKENQANPSSGSTGCRTTTSSSCYLYKSDGNNFKLLAHCTPEGAMNANDPYYDPCRPVHAWQVSSNATVRGVTGPNCYSSGGW